MPTRAVDLGAVRTLSNLAGALGVPVAVRTAAAEAESERIDRIEIRSRFRMDQSDQHPKLNPNGQIRSIPNPNGFIGIGSKSKFEANLNGNIGSKSESESEWINWIKIRVD